MTSLLEGTDRMVTRGTDIGARIDGLDDATRAARGRLDDAIVDESVGVVERAAGRLRLSATHTVVGIAGATGSGKSSTFNALTGLELSAVGVRRPTTSWATACVWGRDGADALLEWLGIPPRHQTTRDSMLDNGRRDQQAELDGVVLLDLPDHDSTEVSHHLEVDRLVSLADLLVWVVDPQKYADAAIHDRYLKPAVEQQDIMLVVLNHIDTVPEERRQSMLDDIRRLLDQDGLQRVPVLPVSARLGTGIPELRAEIARRAAQKQSTRAGIDADVRAAAGRLAEANGDAPTRVVEPARVATLDAAFAEAAGVPVVVDAVERSVRQRGHRATGWPVVGWVSGLKADPLKRLDLDLGARGSQLSGRSRTALPEATQVQRARVDDEVRTFADEVTVGMTPPWVAAVRRAAPSRLDELGDRLDQALARTDLGVAKLPGWMHLLRVLQWLLLLTALGGLGWTGVLLATGKLQDADTPQVFGVAVALVLLVGGLVLGIVLGLAARIAVGRAARGRAARADEHLREAVNEVTHELVIEPVEAELAAYAAVRAGVDRARA
ncbi:GTPase [Nocardioides soli]|uniref:GTP-binding protein EngB required for normal cell division n=1 Tax=Nocardioides soli TaxID=1036020 RepID=A0A7W4YZN7_9ACTN|nr:GTPase [Nocardioides soli]MBB3040953.1 GTP-binding protein EngB required for normal cell division [Nocardioides soli]